MKEEEKKQKKWRILTSGLPAGAFYNVRKAPICYVHGNQFIKIYIQDKDTIVERSFIAVESDGTIIHNEKQILCIKQKNQLRIYQEAIIARTAGLEQDYITYNYEPLSNYIKVSERKEENEFYITFDYIERQWKGVWGKPKLNWKVWIKQNGQLVCSNKWRLKQANKKSKEEQIQFICGR